MDDKNPQRDLAYQLVEFSGENVFLTGKAGTGKTTFLRNLRSSSSKRIVVLAPTGVAAVNAGGMTIHSFFQLAFGLHLPGYEMMQKEGKGVGQKKFNKHKIKLIKSMDLLVIDEISMVRADLLDVIDAQLRKYKDKHKPFGGTQLLMIGDLHQLPPIVNASEEELIKMYYPSPYFFDSQVLQATPYVRVELKHIYRQQEADFISILNKIRTLQLDEEVFTSLRKRFNPQFEDAKNEGYITLATHNHIAKTINDTRIGKLKTPLVRYHARVEGNFPPSNYPNEEVLTLKVGAQVMFNKNDPSSAKRYFNGKIGKVVDVEENYVTVQCFGENEVITTTWETWNNVKFKIDEASKQIEEEIEGTFTQMPLRLAWGITIHKSQGLTFSKVIIDAENAFAHGQIYVALSRCSSLDGLVLKTMFGERAVKQDPTVIKYSKLVEQHFLSEQEVDTYKRVYHLRLLSEQFNFTLFFNELIDLKNIINSYLSKLYPVLLAKIQEAVNQSRVSLLQVGNKFTDELNYLFERHSDQWENHPEIKERVYKASIYFQNQMNGIFLDFLPLLKIDIDKKETKDLYLKSLEAFVLLYLEKQASLANTVQGFSVNGYLGALCGARLQDWTLVFKKGKKAKEEKAPSDIQVAEAEGDILHPDLFEALRSWRSEKAYELQKPAYIILSQKALLGITNTLPMDSAELLRVKGVGKDKLEKFGAEILEMVLNYRASI